MDFLPILIAVIAVFGFIVILMILSGSKNKHGSGGKQKSRQNIIKDATRKLAQNPHNPDGLIPLANLYYQDQLWEKAYPLYETMLNIAVAHPEINLGQTALRQGICALKVGKTEEAFKGLLQARKINPDNFETNFYLGQALINNKEYDKAIENYQKALSSNPNDEVTLLKLGNIYKLKNDNKSAADFYKKSL